jgi:hypothetical protein
MTVKDSAVTVGEPLAEEAKQRIAGLRREIATASDPVRKVRELERLQLYHSVVRRLESPDAVMREVALAHLGEWRA